MLEAVDSWQQHKPYQQSSASSMASHERHHDNLHYDNERTQQQQQQRPKALHATWKSALETDDDDHDATDNWDSIGQRPTNSGETKQGKPS